MRNQRRRGLTVVEVIVVLVCVVLIVCLLLPSVGHPSERMRKAQCKNNMRQIGLALAMYVDAYGMYPPAVTWREADQQSLLSDGRMNPEWAAWAPSEANPFADSPRQVGANWMIAILPFIEEKSLYRIYNPELGIPEAENMKLRSAQMRAYLCPSDPNNQRHMTNYKTDLPNDSGWARGNYGATGAIWLRGSETVGVNSYYRDHSQNMYHPLQRRKPKENRETIRNSVMGFNGSATPDEISDGMSKTVTVWELTTGRDPADPRGTWALGKTGSSIVGACWNIPGSNTTCNGINSNVPGDDDVKDCIDLPTSWSWSKPKNQCNNTADRQSAPRSYHNEGVHALLADGSVRYINQKVDQNLGQSFDTIMGDEVIRAEQ